MTFTVVKVLARHRVLDISLGLQHSCVLVEPGHVYTLGCNSEAQLGCGSTRPQVAPISVKLFQQRPAVVSVCHLVNSASCFRWLHFALIVPNVFDNHYAASSFRMLLRLLCCRIETAVL